MDPIQIRIDHYVHPDPSPESVSSKLDQILTLLTQERIDMSTMNATTTDLVAKLNAAVADNKTIAGSLETLATGQHELIAKLKTGDPDVDAAIDEATQILIATNTAAAANVVANTDVVAPSTPTP